MYTLFLIRPNVCLTSAASSANLIRIHPRCVLGAFTPLSFAITILSARCIDWLMQAFFCDGGMKEFLLSVTFRSSEMLLSLKPDRALMHECTVATGLGYMSNIIFRRNQYFKFSIFILLKYSFPVLWY